VEAEASIKESNVTHLDYLGRVPASNDPGSIAPFDEVPDNTIGSGAHEQVSVGHDHLHLGIVLLQFTAELWGKKKSPSFEKSRVCTRRLDLIHPDPE
jgi:hypothetical protein